MHVLIADKFEQSGRDGLQAIGCEVSFQPDLKDEALVAAIAKQQPDVLVVRGTKVTEPMLAAGPLKLIVRAGAGYNTIDVAAASRRGIYVSNCPGKNSIAVAELAFALILALDRRIADAVIALRAGEWNKKEFSKARGLFGRTLGFSGFGQDWPGDDSARPRFRHAGRRLEPQSDAGTRRLSWASKEWKHHSTWRAPRTSSAFTWRSSLIRGC